MTLTAERLRELLHYEPETGVFTWLQSRRRGYLGRVAGRLRPDGYIEIGVDGRIYLAHRLAWLHATGAWPALHIDHRNNLRGDNRFLNLRDVTHEVNTQNTSLRGTGNSTGFKGVSRVAAAVAKPFAASISVNRKKKHLGCFATGEEAHAAYVEAKKRLHAGAI